jgi:hypothetical protein
MGRIVQKGAIVSNGLFLLGFLAALIYPLCRTRLFRPIHVVWLLAIAAVVLLYKHMVILRLKSYDVPGDTQRLLQTARRVTSALGWTIVAAGDDCLVATAGETEWRAGQLVTIIAQPNKLYLNSRNQLDSGGQSSIAFGKNRKHLSDFLARMRATPLAPPTSAPRELVGRWRLVRSSRETPSDSEMDIRPDGRMYYTVPSSAGKRRVTVEVFYEIDGNELVADVPSAPRKSRSHFFFEDDGTLRIENQGAEAWFERTG